MEDIAELGLAVRSDGVVVAKDRLHSFKGEAAGADTAAAGLAATTTLLTRAMGLLGVVLGGGELIRMTSTWTDLNSRVRNVVGSHEAAVEVMGRLQDMARRTYSGLVQTAESYLLNARALEDLGYRTEEQLDFTEALNNALVVSGSKGERAASVVNAMSKAMALGKLSGENLNVVLQSGDRVVEALADGLGVSTIELRKLAAEGKLTSDTVFKALTSQLEELREEAEAMPATIVDAFQILGDAILTTVGEIDEFTGASSAIAEGIIAVGDNINVVIPILAGLAGIIVTALVPALWSAVVAMTAFFATPIGLIALAVAALAAGIAYLWNEQRTAAQETEKFTAALGQNADALEIARTASQKYREELQKRLTTQLAAAEGDLATAKADVAQGEADIALLKSSGDVYDYTPEINRRAEAVKALEEGIATLKQQLVELAEIMTTPPGGTGHGGGGDDPAEKMLKAYDKVKASAAERIAQLEVEAATLGMTDQAKLSLTNTTDLLNEAERTGIDLWAIDAETGELRIQQLLKLSDAMTAAQLRLEGLQMTMENRTPWEVMGDSIEKLDEQLAAKNMTMRDYQIGVGQAAEEMVRGYTSAASDILGNVEKFTDALNLKGKEAFEVQKTLSLAKAVVSGGEAIVHSYNAGTAIGGPVTGAIFAGIAAAATAAQIASIASSTYQSKSLRNATGSSGGGATATAAAPAQAINLVVHGSKGSSIDIDAFTDQLTNSIKRGGQSNLINVIRQETAA